MKLKDIELIPGSVLDNKDPLHRGRIKACAAGIFDTRVQDIEGMPWIPPLMMSGNQSYQTMELGRQVWILKNEENTDEFWYIPMFQIQGETRKLIKKGKNVDVMFSRNDGPSSASMVYTPDYGISLNVGKTSGLEMTHDDKINISGGGTEINFANDIVTIGDPEKSQAMVLGSALKFLLIRLHDNLLAVKEQCVFGDNAVLYGPLEKLCEHLNEDLEEILARNGKVS